ncbi:unnamed protein product [Ophioblennius macclurei]
MLPAAVQVLALALALLGILGAAAATLLPNWQVSEGAWPGGMAAAAARRMRGLWTDCVWFGSGAFSCAVQSSPLALPVHLLTARAAMVLCCLVALVGLCLAALGLKCTHWGGGHRAKAYTAMAAGACFVLASLLCLVAAAWFTNEVIAAFLTADPPDGSKYQPGGALGLTFVSAGFLLAAGVIFCMSCPGTCSSRPATSGDLVRTAPKATACRSVRLQTDTTPPQGAGPPLQGHKELRDNYSLREYV